MVEDYRIWGLRVWDGKPLAGYGRKAYHIEYGVNAAQKLIHRVGFVHLRPTTVPLLPFNERTLDQFLKEEMIPLIKDPTRVFAFTDQVHFMVQPYVTALWAPKGSNPVVLSKSVSDATTGLSLRKQSILAFKP